MMLKCTIAICITVIILYLLKCSKELQIARMQNENNPLTKFFSKVGKENNENDT